MDNYIILWTGNLPENRVRVVRVEDTFFTRLGERSEIEKEEKKIEEEWKSREKEVYNGSLWRYEGWRHKSFISNSHKERGLEVKVSDKINYKWHFVMRERKLSSMYDYPNPFSVNALLVTEDKYIVLGCRREEEKCLVVGLMGGFIESRNGEPEPIFDAVYREILEEVNFVDVENPIKKDKARLLGLVYGSERSTSAVVYVPLSCAAKDIYLNEEEHIGVMFLPLNMYKIDDFLNTKGASLKVKAVTHCLASIELLVKNMEELELFPSLF